MNKRLLVIIPLVLGLLFIGLLTVRWGLASVYQWRSEQVMDQLSRLRVTEPAYSDALRQGYDYIAKAQKLAAYHPELDDLKGQLLTFDGRQLAEVGDDPQYLYEEAAISYRRALEKRPLWPYTWVNLVTVKASLGQFDQEFRRALRRTIETGPREPRVQLQLLRVYMVYQDRLSFRVRESLEQVKEMALGSQPVKVIDLAAELGQLWIVCPYLTSDQLLEADDETMKVLALCKRHGWNLE